MATQLMDHYKCIYLLGNSDQLLWLQEYLIDEASDRRTDGMVPEEPICTCNSVVLRLLNYLEKTVINMVIHNMIRLSLVMVVNEYSISCSVSVLLSNTVAG